MTPTATMPRGVRAEAPAPKWRDRTCELGRLVVKAKASNLSLWCDRMAVADWGGLYYLSVTGSSNQVRALSALLSGGAGRPTLDPGGIPFERGDKTAHFGGYNRSVQLVQGGYRRYSERLPYGLTHSVFVSKAENFLASISGESVWQELMSNRYTTPLLRPWMRYITRRLIDARQLTACWGYRIRCGLLDVTSDQLDIFVTEGIRSGELRLSEDSGAAGKGAA